MTEKNVEELYGKLSKHIAKKNRQELKSSLEECGNGKYESLKNFEPKKKAPFSNLTFMMAWISALFGCAFLVLNLLVFCLLVPSVSVAVQDTTVQIISTIMMVFDIILTVILFIYWLAIVFIHRSRAQEDNLKAINEIIKK